MYSMSYLCLGYATVLLRVLSKSQDFDTEGTFLVLILRSGGDDRFKWKKVEWPGIDN